MPTLDFPAEIRRNELQGIARHLPARARILEVGAGTGEQSKALMEMGYDVVPIEITSFNYANVRVVPVIDYDGNTFPVPDHSIDVVFSSMCSDTSLISDACTPRSGAYSHHGAIAST